MLAAVQGHDHVGCATGARPLAHMDRLIFRMINGLRIFADAPAARLGARSVQGWGRAHKHATGMWCGLSTARDHDAHCVRISVDTFALSGNLRVQL